MTAGFSEIKHQIVMNAKEKFTDDAMRSLDGVGRATLDQSVREKMLKGMQDAGSRMQDAGYGMQDAGYRIQDTGYRIQDQSFSLLWKFAAVLLLLISLNVFTMVYFNKSSANSVKSTNPVVSEYFSYMDTINL